MVAGNRLPFAALGFAIAAALCAWTPLAAPFGVVVGLATAVIAVRAVVERRRRPVAVAALCVALLAAAGSAFVLARTAGVGRRGPGEPVVEAPPDAAVEAELGAAAERTRAARERARRELDGAGAGREERAAPETPPPGPSRPADPSARP